MNDLTGYVLIGGVWAVIGVFFLFLSSEASRRFVDGGLSTKVWFTVWVFSLVITVFGAGMMMYGLGSTTVDLLLS